MGGGCEVVPSGESHDEFGWVCEVTSLVAVIGVCFYEKFGKIRRFMDC